MGAQANMPPQPHGVQASGPRGALSKDCPLEEAASGRNCQHGWAAAPPAPPEHGGAAQEGFPVEHTPRAPPPLGPSAVRGSPHIPARSSLGAAADGTPCFQFQK